MILRGARTAGRSCCATSAAPSSAPRTCAPASSATGVPMIGLAVIPQPNTNAIAIADEFYRRLDEHPRAARRPTITIEIGYDFTTLRAPLDPRGRGDDRSSPSALVALIIYLFLRSWRSTLIPVLAIPVSIVATFFVMYLAGFTINVLTLVGHRARDRPGLRRRDRRARERLREDRARARRRSQAALEGSREIYFAVISTTVTLAAVFVPIVFLEGLTGRLFREFGVVVVGAVLVSAFVALTLSPMMCRFLLARAAEPRRASTARRSRFFDALDARLPAHARRVPRRGAGSRCRRSLAAVGASSRSAGRSLPSELAPLEDRSNIRVNVRAPEGASFEFTQHQMDRIAVLPRATRCPRSRARFAIAAPGSGGGAVEHGPLQPLPDGSRASASARRRRSSSRSRATSSAFTGVRAFPAQPPTIGDRRAGQPVQYVLQAPTLEELLAVLPEFLEAASASPVLRFVDADLKVNRPEGSIRDRSRSAPRARRLGARRRAHAAARLRRPALRLLPAQRPPVRRDRPGRARRPQRPGGPREPVRARARRRDDLARQPGALRRDASGPAAIYRFNRFTSATISAGLAPGDTIGDGIAALDEIARAAAAARRSAPASPASRATSPTRARACSSRSRFALVLIYLMLAAQFESFRDPIDHPRDGAALARGRARSRCCCSGRRSTSSARSASSC